MRRLAAFIVLALAFVAFISARKNGSSLFRKPTFGSSEPEVRRVSRLRKFVRRYAVHLFVAVAAIAIVTVFFVIFFDAGITLHHGDGISKLNNARRVFDNVDGKLSLAQLGGVWLPLMSVLMLPTVWIDSLYRTGLSGSIPSMISFVVTAVAVFEIVRTLTSSRVGGLAASALVMLNLNLLYFATSPMSESLVVAVLAVCALFLVKLEQSPRSLKWLLVAGIALGVSTLARYELWFITIAIALPVMVLAFWTKRVRGWELVARVMALFAVPVFVMSCWIVGWEYAVFGDPLFFATSKYSAHAIDVISVYNTDAVGNLPTALERYLGAMEWTLQWVSLAVATAGIVLFILKSVLRKEKMVSPAYLLGIPIFYVTSLYLGQNAIKLIDRTFTGNLNTRYGLMAIVLVAVAVGYLVGNFSSIKVRYLKWLGRVVVVVVVAAVGFFLVQLWDDPVENIVVNKELPGQPDENIEAMSIWLGANYEGGRVLVESFGINNSIQHISGIPLREFLTEASPELWQLAMENPAEHVDWVITMGKEDTVTERMKEFSDFDRYYELVFETPLGAIYERRGEPISIREGGTLESGG